ncbi:flagellar basal body P-ring formation chaperone FlgA [Sphaerotilus sp.]|uniref:flagellar basal body P-ring formation chaperone FlgA n=1 Tax=Sphaerotilus sp. TaxID=2093942 RepID=UPI002ACDCC19|nr:flagellar basal body P-ring formation chaperone FlgA [Sphaerotilus sp.]MDZ7856352.1 flagellar basal body P-ring formation chaperone FlgA [Sphaerotilus sp.]
MISLPLLRQSSAPCPAQVSLPPESARHRRPPRVLVAVAVTLGLALLTTMSWADTRAAVPRSATPGAATNTDSALPAALARSVVDVTRSAMADAGDARVEVLPGQLDARLRLAPCQQIEPYLPPGVLPWGRTRVGLRCVSGPVAWNVYLPVTVKVWRKAVVSTAALAAGSELSATDLQIAEVDVANSSAPVFTDTSRLLGRRLVNGVGAGAALRADNLRVRQWFAAGDKVTLVYRGEGFEASTDGQALNSGMEGQAVRVRVGSGQVITGLPTGQNRVEVRS